MNRIAKSLAIFTLLPLASGIAQSTVKTTSGGTAGTVPIFTTSTNVENSAITQSGSNVGIGTTNPGGILGIGGASIPMGMTTEGGGTAPLLNFDVNFRESNMNTAYPGAAVRIDARSPVYPLIQFLTRPANGSESVAMAISETGSVGIGTTAPNTKLEVNGPVTLTAGSNGSITFPDGTVQTTAYPASTSGGSAPIEVQNNQVVINQGISSDGSGIKHMRTGASCTTGSGIGSACQIVVNWPGTPFTDTDYTVTCTPKAASFSGGTASFDLTIPDANKTTISTAVTVTTLVQGTSTTVTGLNCIAIHD